MNDAQHTTYQGHLRQLVDLVALRDGERMILQGDPGFSWTQFVADVAVATLAALLSLGIAFLIYRWTRKDQQADTALQLAHQLKLSTDQLEQQREIFMTQIQVDRSNRLKDEMRAEEERNSRERKERLSALVALAAELSFNGDTVDMIRDKGYQGVALSHATLDVYFPQFGQFSIRLCNALFRVIFTVKRFNAVAPDNDLGRALLIEDTLDALSKAEDEIARVLRMEGHFKEHMSGLSPEMRQIIKERGFDIDDEGGDLTPE